MTTTSNRYTVTTTLGRISADTAGSNADEALMIIRNLSSSVDVLYGGPEVDATNAQVLGAGEILTATVRARLDLFLFTNASTAVLACWMDRGSLPGGAGESKAIVDGPYLDPASVDYVPPL